MDSVVQVENTSIGEGRAYVIAEVASAHCGSLDKMKKIISRCAQTGCDAFKVQMYNVDFFVSKFHPNYQNNKNNQFSPEQWEDIFSFAQEFPMHLWADVFDEGSADLAECFVDGFKLHSTDINNPFMIDYVSQKGKPIILSTGGSTLTEIARAVERVSNFNNQLILMEGFQDFPTALDKVNLKRLEFLKEKFDCPVGYHDHTDAESEMAKILPLTAFAYGASVIEKHVTDNRAEKGFDYISSLNPDELTDMVRYIRDFENALGNDKFVLSDEEREYRKVMKRYIVAKQDISKGEIVSENHLAFKRSTEGLGPNEYEKIIGLSAARNIEKDETIRQHDLENKVILTLAVRLKSKRLPQKALVDVEGQTAIEHQIDRLKRCKNGEIVLCTSDLEEDVPLIDIAKKKGIKYFAGSADDVMDRFMKCAERENANIVVRTTGDSPLTDPEIIDAMIDYHIFHAGDFTGIENIPVGLEAEVVNLSTLKDARTRVEDPKDTEYMTHFIKDPEHFKVLIMDTGEELNRDYRITLDTLEDLEVVRKIYGTLYESNNNFTTKDVIEYLDANPEVVEINKDYSQIRAVPKLEDLQETKGK
jgi:N,N'-diacetyllegionaminate synthase